MPYPIDWIRSRFPALAGDTVYLDNAAGAQVPHQVVLNVVEALTEMNVNKGAAYGPSQRITAAKERVRERTAAFLNADPRQVAFGPNATTLAVLLAEALGRRIEPGDELVVTGLDHHANVDPWRALARLGVRLRTWRPRGPEARLDPGDLSALLGPRTRLVAMTAASNALGSYTPVSEVAELLGGRYDGGERPLLMVDAVHYAPHRIPDVADLGADLLMFSPYKVVGPHLGALYLGPRAADLGGHPLAFLPDDDPIAWEPGTQNHEAIHGFGGTFDYLDEVGAELGSEPGRAGWAAAFRAFEAHERELLGRLLDGLDALGAERYGLPGVDGRTATVAFNLPGRSPHAVAEALADRGIGVASGHYYAFELMMRQLGLADRGGAVRVGLLHYTAANEIEALLGALAEIVRRSPG